MTCETAMDLIEPGGCTGCTGVTRPVALKLSVTSLCFTASHQRVQKQRQESEGCLPGVSDRSTQLCQPSSRSFSLGLDELGGRSLLGALAPLGELAAPTPLLPADAPLLGLGIRLPDPGAVLNPHSTTCLAAKAWPSLTCEGA